MSEQGKNSVEGESCPPGVRLVAGYEAYCVVCGKAPQRDVGEISSWDCIDGAENDLDNDWYTTLKDGRRVCADSFPSCWRYCTCDLCEDGETVIGVDQESCKNEQG